MLFFGRWYFQLIYYAYISILMPTTQYWGKQTNTQFYMLLKHLTFSIKYHMAKGDNNEKTIFKWNIRKDSNLIFKRDKYFCPFTAIWNVEKHNLSLDSRSTTSRRCKRESSKSTYIPWSKEQMSALRNNNRDFEICTV